MRRRRFMGAFDKKPDMVGSFPLNCRSSLGFNYGQKQS